MFCTNCGAEISNGARFCTHCGANVSDAGVIYNGEREGHLKSVISVLLSESIDVIKMIFTKRPLLAIKKYAHEKSYVGVTLATIAVLFFSFVACINITQLINFGFSAAVNKLISSLTVLADVEELYAITYVNLDIEIPILYELYGRLLLISILVFLSEFILTFLIVRLRKQKPESLLCILNVVGIAYMPIVIGEIVSLIIGFFLPYMVIIVMIFAIFAKLIFIYEGIREIGLLENEPVWEISLFAFLMSIVITVIGSMFIKGFIEIIGQSFMNKIGSFSDAFSKIMGLF